MDIKQNETENERVTRILNERSNGMAMVKRALPYLSDPSYRFEVGDTVHFGAMKSAVVEEVLHDEKIYGLRCIATSHNYGNPFDYETYAVAIWTDVRPFTDGDTAFFCNEDIHLNFNNITLESLIHKYYHFGINTDPDYQREYVWGDNDRAYLIGSVFENADIGKFVLAKKEQDERTDQKMYDIVDGKQRLITLIRFYENRLSFRGFYFNDLSLRDKNLFLNHPVAEAEIDRADKKTILRYFIMLNTGGRVMDKEHLAKVRAMLEATV